MAQCCSEEISGLKKSIADQLKQVEEREARLLGQRAAVEGAKAKFEVCGLDCYHDSIRKKSVLCDVQEAEAVRDKCDAKLAEYREKAEKMSSEIERLKQELHEDELARTKNNDELEELAKRVKHHKTRKEEAEKTVLFARLNMLLCIVI